MKLIDNRKRFCPAGCGTNFKKRGVLGFGLHADKRKDYGTFEYECPKCGMSYELDILQLDSLGFKIKED
jgi:ribosomal protein S27AE